MRIFFLSIIFTTLALMANEQSTALYDCVFNLRNREGAPLDGRILIYDEQGKLLPNAEPFYLVRGSCQIKLPAGNYLIQADAGMRVNKEKLWLLIGEQSPNTATFTLDQYTWEKSAGWNLGNPFFVNPLILPAETPKIAELTQLFAFAKSAGLNVLGVTNLSQIELSQKNNSLDDEKKLTDAMTKDNDCLLIYAWQNSAKNFYVLEPRPYLATTKLSPTVRVSALLASARDRSALTVLTQATGEHQQPPLPEMLFNLLAGNLYSAIDITRGGEDYLFWQFLLELGWRLPAVAGGGNYPNLSMYLHTAHRYAPTPDYLRTLSEGRSIISNGPFVRLFVIDENEERERVVATIGDALPLSARPRTIYVDAYACADENDNIARLELLYNGKILATAKGKPDQKTMQVTWNELTLEQSGWLQIRYISTAGYLWAISNPIYVGNIHASFTRGAISNLTLKINAPTTNAGTLTIENFGVTIFSRTVNNNDVITCRVPATAEVLLDFPELPPYRQTLYAISGAQQYSEQIVANAPRSLRQKEVWQQLAEIISTITATIAVR